MDLEKSGFVLLKYPIGDFEYGKKYSKSDTRMHIKVLEKLPQRL